MFQASKRQAQSSTAADGMKEAALELEPVVQLLVDDYLVRGKTGLERRFASASKVNNDKPGICPYFVFDYELGFHTPCHSRSYLDDAPHCALSELSECVLMCAC